MKRFYAVSEGFKKFELLAENRTHLAELSYLKWYSFDVQIQSPQGKSEIKMEGNWNSTLVQYGYTKNKIREYKMGWKGMVLTEESGEQYLFKSKMSWNFNYVLVDKMEKELVNITAEFSWKSFKTKYIFEIADDFEADPELLLGLVHCINYQAATTAGSS